MIYGFYIYFSFFTVWSVESLNGDFETLKDARLERYLSCYVRNFSDIFIIIYLFKIGI